MLIGVPKEIKDHEYRVSVTPDGVRALCASGHQVLMEPSAGHGSGFTDEDYRRPAPPWQIERTAVPSKQRSS